MSGARSVPGWMSVEEYLAFEEAHPERHEYVDGDVYAMNGGTFHHSQIAQNVAFRLVSRAQDGPCSVDRGEKLDGYRRLPSLQAYFIVDHRRRRVDRHWRDSGGVWLHEELTVDGEVPVPCIGGWLTLDEIYRGVELPNIAEPEPVEYV